MNEKPPKPKRRFWLRWLVRLVLVGLILSAAGGYWVWKERLVVVNTLIVRLGGDMRVQFGALDWEEGVLHLKEVSITHVPTAERFFVADHIEWRPEWGQVRSGNLGGLKVEGAALDASLALFQGRPTAQGTGSAVSKPWRFELLTLGRTDIVLRDESGAPVSSAVVQGTVRGGTSAPSFDSAKVEMSEVLLRGNPVAGRLSVEASMHEGIIELSKGSARGGRVDLAWIRDFNADLDERFKELRGGLSWEWDGRDMKFSTADLLSGGSHELKLKKLQLGAVKGEGGIRLESVAFKLSQDVRGVWHVKNGMLQRPEVNWTRDLEEALMPKGGSSSKAVWEMWLDGLEVRDGQITLSETLRCPVAGEFAWNTRLDALRVTPDAVHSAVMQRLEIADLTLRWRRQDPLVKRLPFIALKKGVVEVIPDEVNNDWRVESLELDEPRLMLNPENGPWFEKVISQPAKTVPVNTGPKPWQRLHFGALAINGGTFDLAMDLAARVEASTRFEVVTEHSRQHLYIADLKARVPKRANLPVLSLEKVEVVAILPEMWRSRRLESIQLKGGQIEVGEALMTLFSGEAAVVEDKVDAAVSRWTAGKVEMEKLGVTLMSIAPGLPPVRFDVTFTANETPLDLDGLAENVEPQRVVLTRLRIPSPYDPLRTVAEMDVIHVNYTLDGLLHRRIDRVDIISPLLYVGEDLFWYVENYRKLMKGEVPLPDVNLGPPPPQKPSAQAWKVDTLAVVDGRLLLAPKGVPLKGFGKPFPFSFTSRLESGQLDAVFDIPTDNYTLQDLKLEFRRMKGQVRFNLPMKDRNNNLTETFTVEQLRWKQLHVEDAHLSVTYDAHGIYGIFGGAGYDGYINGAFDIYLDESYTWDGWVSGVGVDLGPVTTALFPEYFLLDGVVEGKIVATGNMKELYQADAEFKNRSRGMFSIAALNDMIDRLPPVMKGDLSDQITRMGLETLRDFRYDSVDGKARLYGREGRGHLRFAGPYGARNIEVNVYDHRWKEEPSQSETADAAAER